MSEKCVAIDGKIEHYRHLSFLIVDRRTVDAIKLLISRMEAEKQALHPDRTAVCSDLDNRNRDPSLAT